MAEITVLPQGLREHVPLASGPGSALLASGLRHVTLSLSRALSPCPEQPELTQTFPNPGWPRVSSAPHPQGGQARGGAPCPPPRLARW